MINVKFLGGYLESSGGVSKMTVVFRYDAKNKKLIYVPINTTPLNSVYKYGYMNLNDYFRDIEQREALSRVSISALLLNALYTDDSNIVEVPMYFGKCIGENNVVFENNVPLNFETNVFYYTDYIFDALNNKASLSKNIRKVNSNAKVSISDDLFTTLYPYQDVMFADLLILAKSYSYLVGTYKKGVGSNLHWIDA